MARELIYLLYALAVLVESIALLIGDGTMVVLMRSFAGAVTLLCYHLRRASPRSGRSPDASDNHAGDYHTPLIVLFALTDSVAYATTLALTLAFRSHAASLWLYLFLLLNWGFAVARVVSEFSPTCRNQLIYEQSRDLV